MPFTAFQTGNHRGKVHADKHTKALFFFKKKALMFTNALQLNPSCKQAATQTAGFITEVDKTCLGQVRTLLQAEQERSTGGKRR